MPATPNFANRGPHRIRSRRSAQRIPEWELFQSLLGYAFTLQRELDRQVCDPIAAEREQGLHPALQRVVACAQNLTEASGAAIALGTPDAMVCVVRSGASAPPEGARMDARNGLSGECIRNGTPAICVNAAADPRVNFQACRALDVASMVYYPLRSEQGKLIGVLGVFSSRALHFSQRDISYLRFVEGMVQDALAQNAGEQQTTPFASLSPAEEQTQLPSAAALEISRPEPQAVAAPAAVLTPPKPVASLPRASTPEPRPIPKVEPKPETIFVGRVVDESVRDVELDIPDLDAAISTPAPRSPIPAIIALVIVAFIAFAAWNYRSLFVKAEPVAQSVAPSSDAPPATAAVPAPAPESPAAEKILTSEVSLRSQAESATITILLPHAISAEGYGLTNPDRIYFDLHDVKLADAKGKVFRSDEGLISRVRLAQSAAGVTRVVFDLREPATFESRQEQNPQRLIIEMHRAGLAHQETPAPPTGSTKVTIVIDPGHGGRDLGTVSPSGLQEKDLTLDVAQRLGALLQEQLGATVVYTRDIDQFVSLDDRAAIANRTQADFLISIHGNSSPLPSVRGVETYYFKVPPNTQSLRTASARAAADIHQGLLSGLAGKHSSSLDRGIRPANFVVLREAEMPAVLAEISFISNQKDVPKLETPSYREQIAQSLYNGIAKYLSRKNPAKSASIGDLAAQRLPGSP